MNFGPHQCAGLAAFDRELVPSGCAFRRLEYGSPTCSVRLSEALLAIVKAHGWRDHDGTDTRERVGRAHEPRAPPLGHPTLCHHSACVDLLCCESC